MAIHNFTQKIEGSINCEEGFSVFNQMFVQRQREVNTRRVVPAVVIIDLMQQGQR
jgi:hypothetical protein